jgi:hypothetical protein
MWKLKSTTMVINSAMISAFPLLCSEKEKCSFILWLFGFIGLRFCGLITSGQLVISLKWNYSWG